MTDSSLLLSDARGGLPPLQMLRRRLHEHPEIGLDLPVTRQTLLGALEGLGFEIVEGSRTSSIVATARGRGPGPAVVLHADMDALPVLEDEAASPRSQVDGRMHACGHDLHSAALVGAARLIAARTEEFDGRVVFVWQPGEEGYDGMQVMLDEGLMEQIGPDPIATYGLHVLADTFPHGVFTGKAGVSHATSGTFEITVRGTGGHAAFPHAANDPIPAAAEIVLALQVQLTRTIDIFDPVVLTVASFHAGDAANVIPETATLSGTVRAFSSESAMLLPPLIEAVATGVAAAHGVEATIVYHEGYPVVVNDEAEVLVLRSSVTDLLGEHRFTELASPIPAGDDYGRLLERIPGAFFLVGAGLPDRNGRLHPNHSAGASFDDGVLADASAVLALAAIRRLRSWADSN
jgi:amidohydrolase